MYGGVVYKFDRDPSIRIATAVALLTAVVLSTQPSRYRSLSSGACCQSPNLTSPSHHAAKQVRGAEMASRTERVKGVRSESEEESVKAIQEAGGVVDFIAIWDLQPAQYVADAGSFRSRTPLRC